MIKYTTIKNVKNNISTNVEKMCLERLIAEQHIEAANGNNSANNF